MFDKLENRALALAIELKQAREYPGTQNFSFVIPDDDVEIVEQALREAAKQPVDN